MDIDDQEPQIKPPTPKNLEVMSIEALYEYIEKLEKEIGRARLEIAAKEKARLGAEDIFKK